MGAHTFVSSLVHCVFSTKGRRKLITSEMQMRLWPYLGGIARQNGFTAIALGGIEDHVHMLLALPPTIAISKALQLLKGGSSKWVHESVAKDFEWQEGYGAFSIGISQREDTVEYINSQGQHHQKRSFQDEFLAFLKKHGIEYDPNVIWD